MAEPLVPSSPATSQNQLPTELISKPSAGSYRSGASLSPSSQLGVNQAPSTSPGVNPSLPSEPILPLPKLVPPPPPPPLSSLPRIPSNFQEVPANVSKQSVEASSLTTSQNQSPLTPPALKPEASVQMPVASLPPPPISTVPAPFSQNLPSGTVVTPKPAETISFDQPPTTILEPGDDPTNQPPQVNNSAPVQSQTPATSSQLPSPLPTVQDLEI